MSLERITNAVRVSVIMVAATGYVAAMYGAGLIAHGARAYRFATESAGNLIGSLDEHARHPVNALLGNAPARNYRAIHRSAHAASDFGHNLPDADPLPSNDEVIVGVERLLRENERNYH